MGYTETELKDTLKGMKDIDGYDRQDYLGNDPKLEAFVADKESTFVVFGNVDTMDGVTSYEVGSIVKNENLNEENSVWQEDKKANAKKLTGKITACSEFSEGKAFVQTSDNENITYCIDKNGYILFELPEKIAGVSLQNL